jgi:hypothetical protein
MTRRFLKNLAKVIVVVSTIATACLHSQAQGSGPVEDRDIQVVHYQPLIYPPLDKLAAIQGVVVVWVSLSNGNVIDAKAVSGNADLIPACLMNVKKWRFRPNKQNAAVVIYYFKISPDPDGTYTRVCKAGSSLFSFHKPNLALVEGCPERVQESNSH